MKTLKSGLATAAAAIMTAAALAGCAGGPEDPDSSLAPREDTTASVPASAETAVTPGDEPTESPMELWSVLEEYEGEHVLAGVAQTYQAGTRAEWRDQQVPLETDELEVHIYCTPVGASAQLVVNSERLTIDCPGMEEPVTLSVDTGGAESSSDIEWQLRIDDSVNDWQEAVALLPAG